MKNQMFVAEIKTVSPFGFKTGYALKDLIDLALTHGDAISVHVDSLWGGSSFHLHDIWNEMRASWRDKSIQKKPLIAKGFHLTDKSIEKDLHEFGADICVVVGRIPAKKYLKNCWLEPLTPEQANEMASVGPAGIIINRRNLETGRDYGASGTSMLVDLIECKKGTKLIQASMIKSIDNVAPWADAYIVGEELPLFITQKIVRGLAL